MEVIAIGAELDAVLRADRTATALGGGEAGEGGIEGLTVKQEISAIEGGAR